MRGQGRDTTLPGHKQQGPCVARRGGAAAVYSSSERGKLLPARTDPARSSQAGFRRIPGSAAPTPPYCRNCAGSAPREGSSPRPLVSALEKHERGLHICHRRDAQGGGRGGRSQRTRIRRWRATRGMTTLPNDTLVGVACKATLPSQVIVACASHRTMCLPATSPTIPAPSPEALECSPFHREHGRGQEGTTDATIARLRGDDGRGRSANYRSTPESTDERPREPLLGSHPSTRGRHAPSISPTGCNPVALDGA